MNGEQPWQLPADKTLGCVGPVVALCDLRGPFQTECFISLWWLSLTFSQNQPELTPQLSCPMVTLLRGLRRAAISTLKRSVLARSNSPPSKKIFPLFFKPLEPWRITWILELVPAPLISPVTTATLYTMPGGIRNLVREKRSEEKSQRVMALIWFMLETLFISHWSVSASDLHTMQCFICFCPTHNSAKYTSTFRLPKRNQAGGDKLPVP